MIKVLDNPFYYLENFHQVLAWIGERYDDLLTAEERHFLAVFPPCRKLRALFVRMVMRKGTCSAPVNWCTPKSAARMRRHVRWPSSA
jgi:hypothetical protein